MHKDNYGYLLMNDCYYEENTPKYSRKGVFKKSYQFYYQALIDIINRIALNYSISGH